MVCGFLHLNQFANHNVFRCHKLTNHQKPSCTVQTNVLCSPSPGCGLSSVLFTATHFMYWLVLCPIGWLKRTGQWYLISCTCRCLLTFMLLAFLLYVLLFLNEIYVYVRPLMAGILYWVISPLVRQEWIQVCQLNAIAETEFVHIALSALCR